MDNTRLESFLMAMQRIGASTMHLVPGRPPCLRVQRRVVELEEPPIGGEEIDEFVRDLLFSDHRKTLARTGHVEILYMGRDRRRHRVSVSECAGVRTLTLRPLPNTVPTLDTLDLPEQVGALGRHRTGLALVAGFVGSGKRTTMAALVNLLGQDPGRHIVTIDESIDFVHNANAALLHQQEIGAHVESAVVGIRQAVAAGADTIVVSRLRDDATLEAALAAAESGCMVYCGVESGSVVGALTELVLGAPAERRERLRSRLARVLRGVTAQYLLPRSHRSGRVAVVEVLVGCQVVRDIVRTGRFDELPGIMHRYRGLGMQTADAALRSLQAAHLVSQDDAKLHLPSADVAKAPPVGAAPR